MKHLGIDYGTKRTGVAISDETGLLARPYEVLDSRDDLLGTIAEIVRNEEIEMVVVGMPYDLRGEETDITRLVRDFLEKLRDLLPCSVEEHDEAMSSRRAVERMVHAGVGKKKRRQKGKTDTWAAALILQEYLDQAK